MIRKMIRKVRGQVRGQTCLRACALEIPFIPSNNSLHPIIVMTHYALLLMIAFMMASCAPTTGGSGGSISMGQGDLDSSIKSGDYYTRLNASKNKHLPKGKPYKVRGQTYVPYTSANGFEEIGVASWYGPGFHGKLTANGEKYNQNGITAAHKLLPFGTMVRVTNLENGKTVVVRINDRGPFLHGRIIDLSKGAAHTVGMVDSGTAKVHLSVAGGSNSLSGFNDAGSSNDFGDDGALIPVSGGIFRTGGLLNNPDNPGGLGFPPGKVNRYGETVDRAPVAGEAYAASGQNSTAMGGDGEYGEGVTGFISSDPNEFGDDPTYYDGSAKGVGAYGDNTGSADNFSGDGSGNYTPLPPVPLASIQATDTVTNENFGENSTPNIVSEAAYGKNTNPNPYVAADATSGASYGNSANTGTGMNSQNHEGAPYAFEDMPQSHANNIEQAPVPQSTAGQTLIKPDSTEKKADGTDKKGTYHVQVGAFKNKNNATGLVKALKADNINSKISIANGFNFVKAGPYPSQEEAEKIRTRLRKDFPECYVTVR